jgi:hypothetical protein
MDYSSLITVSKIKDLADSEGFNNNGVIVDFNDEAFGTFTVNDTEYKNKPLFIINEQVTTCVKDYIYVKCTTITIAKYNVDVGTTIYRINDDGEYVVATTLTDKSLIPFKAAVEQGDPVYYIKVLSKETPTASYVVVPINYKEYDRMMSKAYCEPLKR